MLLFSVHYNTKDFCAIFRAMITNMPIITCLYHIIHVHTQHTMFVRKLHDCDHHCDGGVTVYYITNRLHVTENVLIG